MIELTIEEDILLLKIISSNLKPYQENQLAFWGFEFNEEISAFVFQTKEPSQLITKLIAFFDQSNIQYSISENIRLQIEEQNESVGKLETAIEKGRQLKDGVFNFEEETDFLSFLSSNINRKLKDHQIKAALHLLLTQNGANFSVPGSGKTTVVLVVYEWFKQKGLVDSLFVVGPPACFGPWRDEFKAVLGREPSCEILAGGNIEERRSKYLVNTDTVSDLYLTTFQTLQKDWEDVQILLKHQGVKFFLVIDEAHYIKQIEGAWASAALNISMFSARRCILTGTPFPRNFTDAFNLFEFLWPNVSPISEEVKHQISHFEKECDFERAANLLDNCIGALFYRVRKIDLNLDDQVLIEPTMIEMNTHEKLIYDSIVNRIRDVSHNEFINNLDTLIRLRRGRMMRLRQCTSNTALLGTAIDEYEEDLLDNQTSLAHIIRNYSSLETPAKIEKLISIVTDLRNENEKIVIWSNFVRTLELIQEKLISLGYGVRLIYGGTPIQNEEIEDGLTREGIIKDFIDTSSGVDILVANPAACAESISLHKTCSHAIYYDMSYNCAQYLQSLDRIHRVGGSENKKSYYHFLHYTDTIDSDILMNVRRKAENMSAVIDQDYTIYSLDMFSDEEDLEAYERIFCQ